MRKMCTFAIAAIAAVASACSNGSGNQSSPDSGDPTSSPSESTGEETGASGDSSSDSSTTEPGETSLEPDTATATETAPTESMTMETSTMPDSGAGGGETIDASAGGSGGNATAGGADGGGSTNGGETSSSTDGGSPSVGGSDSGGAPSTGGGGSSSSVGGGGLTNGDDTSSSTDGGSPSVGGSDSGGAPSTGGGGSSSSVGGTSGSGGNVTTGGAGGGGSTSVGGSSSAIPCTEHSTCNDNNACTADACSNGVCQNDAMDCDDGVSCTADACDSITAGCTHTAQACPNGQICDVSVGCVATSVWPIGPGTPGAITQIGSGFINAQGMSLGNADNVVQIAGIAPPPGGAGGEGGGAGSAGAAGSAGSAGEGGSGGTGPAVCNYTPSDPTVDVGSLNNQDLLTQAPVFRRIDTSPNQGPCQTNGELVSHMKLHESQNGETVEIFEMPDGPIADEFYGFGERYGNKVPINEEEAIIAGLVMMAKRCEGNRIYIASTGTGNLLELTPSGDGYDMRLIETEFFSISELACHQNTLYITTPREFSFAGWNAAQDPVTHSPLDGLPVEAQAVPLRLYSYSRTPTDAFTLVVEVNGGAKVQSHQQVVMPEVERLIMHGYKDYLAGDGNNLILVDFVNSRFFRIPLGDPLSLEVIFDAEPEDGISGLAVTPTGTIYVSVMPTTPRDSNCTQFTRPLIAALDEQNGILVDWMVFDGDEYITVLPRLCNSGTLYEQFQSNRRWVGANFISLIADRNNPRLFFAPGILGTLSSAAVVE